MAHGSEDEAAAVAAFEDASERFNDPRSSAEAGAYLEAVAASDDCLHVARAVLGARRRAAPSCCRFVPE